MAPVKVKILTVTEKCNEYAGGLKKQFEKAGLRVELDGRNEKIGYKIREARNARDSYIVVIGEKEMETGMLTVRSSKEGELGQLAIAEFIEKLQKEIQEKTC